MGVGHRNGNIGKVIKALQEVGPMTMADVMNETGLNKNSASRALVDLIKDSKRIKKRAYVKEWVYDQEGQRRYPRAVYAWGNKPDKEKPKEDKSVTQKRHRTKKRMLRAVNSVFNFGLLSRGGYTRPPRKRKEPEERMAA